MVEVLVGVWKGLVCKTMLDFVWMFPNIADTTKIILSGVWSGCREEKKQWERVVDKFGIVIFSLGVGYLMG